MKNLHGILSIGFLFSTKKKYKLTSILLLSMFFWSSILVAQNRTVIKGRVLDNKEEPLIGATVMVKGFTKSGTITDINGQFSINVPDGANTLVVSYISFQTQEVNISGKTSVTVSLVDNNVKMSELVVVGFGQQKKQSIVGSITQTSGKVLERAGGVSSLGAALTGNLPGVTTMQTTGKPGEEDPQIIIRGISSWNNSNPLVLVDGIERSMNSVDVNSVESISVLKDASATAVYGVRGANGVVLITTKRGVEGKAKIDVGFSSTLKAPSLLPGKMDSYDALEVKNRAVEYELNQQPNSWSYMNSQSFINMYRNQTTQEQKERYPNIDWQKYEFKDYAMSYNANVNVSGGTKFVKYFAAVDYLHEGDIVKLTPNDKGYESGYAYNRVNSRANLDFQLTKTTKFLINLSGSYGQKKAPMNVITEGYMWSGAYKTPPDIYYPKYSDGSWGWCPTNQVDGANSALNLALGGAEYKTTTRIASDFTLNQDLGKLLKGLSAKLSVSLDNSFLETGRGINNGSAAAKQKYIDPYTGKVSTPNTADGLTNFDYYSVSNWTTAGGSMDNTQTYRNLNYQAQLFYEGTFGDHRVTAMGNAARQQQSTGSDIPTFREDWVFRTTYAFKDKYFAEYNGAYNGSEKFAPANRFAFFSSGALGWMVSEEKFMKKLTFLDMLKLRISYGQIGDDAMNGRWLYMDQLSNSTTQAVLSTTSQNSSSDYSIYKWNAQTQIGNPSISWEKVTKKNIGADFSIFKNLFSGSVDIFNDYRTNISLPGTSRSVPTYFGFTPPPVNVGAVKVHGYELELRYSQNISKNTRLWANASMTHSVDIVENKDDPALYPEYLKAAGYPNNQVKSTISKGFYNTWDELYGSTAFDAADTKIPGNYRILDFDCDGVINSTKDRVRYGYPTNPQNTYNTTIGVDWKGFSAFAQFYGVSNVSRYIQVQSFSNGSLPFFNNVYTEGTYWSKDNQNADSPMPRINNQLNGASEGTRYMYDGSYVRLKNAEIAYTFTSGWVKKMGLQALRVYVNGNNLWLWTNTPDDREVNGSTAYPTVRRYNLGLKLTL
jgi:TonB-linked SusC/RagA family outer membrane protein